MASVIDTALGMLLGSATSGTWSASLCDRLSLSAYTVLLNHQPADSRIAAFMLRMIAQGIACSAAGVPSARGLYTPQCSKSCNGQHPVCSSYAAHRCQLLMRAGQHRKDVVITMGISTLAVIVLCLVDEEQGTFAPATLSAHDDIRWFKSMLLMKAFQQYAGHRLAGLLVILSAILQQQFGGNGFNFAQMHFAVSLGFWLNPWAVAKCTRASAASGQVMSWYANEVWAAGRPCRRRLFQARRGGSGKLPAGFWSYNAASTQLGVLVSDT
ncbi:hypothetical protein WJX77_011553 [Trebouxia sp. C0004]